MLINNHECSKTFIIKLSITVYTICSNRIHKYLHFFYFIVTMY